MKYAMRAKNQFCAICDLVEALHAPGMSSHAFEERKECAFCNDSKVIEYHGLKAPCPLCDPIAFEKGPQPCALSGS